MQQTQVAKSERMFKTIMDTIWIISLILSAAQKSANIIAGYHGKIKESRFKYMYDMKRIFLAGGQSDVEVQLISKQYLDKGSSVTLHCKHNVAAEYLYKVAWLKNGGYKFFEFVNKRMPPFKNYSVSGAEIDFSESNQNEVTLKNLDFDATGFYYCEVSIDNPIFTKASAEEPLHIILRQTGPPKILFKKRHFIIGENLIANCTTAKSYPQSHITWLINGKKVDEIYTKNLHPHGTLNRKNNHRSKPNLNKQQQQQQPAFIADSGNGNSVHDKINNNIDIKSKTNHSQHQIDNSSGRRCYDQQHQQNKKNIISFRHNHHTNFNYKPVEEKDSELNNNDNKYYLIKHLKFRRYTNGDNSSKLSSTENEEPVFIHRTSFASSQLSIRVSKLHADRNGRLEISCLSTIPAHVDPGNVYADYKSQSIKIDVQKDEPTTILPSMIGSPKSTASNHQLSTQLQFACLIVFQLKLVFKYGTVTLL